MKNMKSLLKSFIAVLIVMLGVYLSSFYLRNEISFTSVFCGIMGFLILLPAIKKWEVILFGEIAKDE